MKPEQFFLLLLAIYAAPRVGKRTSDFLILLSLLAAAFFLIF